MDLVAINYSEDQYLSPRDTLEELPGVPCGWHILTVAEMQQGTPEGIRRRYAELAAMGFPENPVRDDGGYARRQRAGVPGRCPGARGRLKGLAAPPSEAPRQQSSCRESTMREGALT